MLVRTRDAAVWAIAYSPALLDLPKISFEATPVTGSVGGKMDIPTSRNDYPYTKRTGKINVSCSLEGKFVQSSKRCVRRLKLCDV